MPAEWEPHRATWIAWPHHEPDWPGKLGPIPWVYAEIARVIADFEPVEILCQSDEVAASADEALRAHGARRDRVRLHVVPTDRVWLRDSAPTGAVDPAGGVTLVNWAFMLLASIWILAVQTLLQLVLASGGLTPGSKLETWMKSVAGKVLKLTWVSSSKSSSM